MENQNLISKKRQERSKIVNYIYGFELFNEQTSSIKAFESGNFTNKEIKKIEKIEKHYNNFKKTAIKYCKKNWSWERILPYLRSIIIYASLEMLVNDKDLVIDEMVILTKYFSPGDDYKFINAILDSLGKHYDKIKNN